ncbi:hypothetical protein [Nocardioides pakistanensis]
MSSYAPCPDCGEYFTYAASESHACEPQRRADYQMLTLRAEVSAFESLFRSYLTRKEGQFEAWLAAQQVRRTA